METNDILLVVFGVALTFIGSMILYRLKAAEDRAKEDRKAAEDRAAEDRAAADQRAAEDRAAAAKIAAEDRAANKADHDRLFDAVSGLQSEVSDIKAVVSVLKDRSDRAERNSAD